MQTDTPDFWESKWKENETPWDLGVSSPQLMDFCINNIENRTSKILIPGGGRAYELTTLHNAGFTNVWLCDWSKSAIEEAQKVNPAIPQDKFLVKDFFKLKMNFDYILEQTFFSAIPPSMREEYVEKTYKLLKERQGRIIALLFDIHFDHEGPPFGGSRKEYREIFSSRFTIERLEKAEKSVASRAGNECFLVAIADS
ncbi:MAG: hypothetical protein R3275_05670 [Saprospiraceae bacterium]|nr:hypothetical protein [Saprospiraceae bacterium]